MTTRRFSNEVCFISVAKSVFGYFAVRCWRSGADNTITSPYLKDVLGVETKEVAELRARDWAERLGVEYVHNSSLS